MSRLATSFVLGYHGCDKSTAIAAIEGKLSLKPSERDYDWLGPGIYFWESDPQRAREWAEWKVARKDYKEAAVIGAVIDLRNCLDLLVQEELDLVRAAHKSFVKVQKLSGLPIPVNKSAKGQPNADRVLRFLDCAVFKHLHSIIDGQDPADRMIEPYDTVRGMFTEGKRLYPGCGFHRYSHVQIAVRSEACIKGIFWPRT